MIFWPNTSYSLLATMNKLDEAILKTLCYRDLFDYPLTEEEITKLLIERSARPKEIPHVLAQLVAEKKVEEKDGFLFLPGRKQVVKTRLKREEVSEKKFPRAARFAKVLRFLPWVRAVFLTGALAAGNSHEEDDIDLLIVARKNRVWLTRLLATLLFDLLRVRRQKGKKVSADQFCLNMFLSETSLTVPDSEQNLYSAHEIVLAYPLWTKDYLHLRFLGENPWVRRYLPNVEIPEARLKAPSGRNSLPATVYHLLSNSFWTLADLFAQKLQLVYMRGKRTREIVERQRILFHPVDLAREILSAYRVRLYRVLHAKQTS